MWAHRPLLIYALCWSGSISAAEPVPNGPAIIVPAIELPSEVATAAIQPDTYNRPTTAVGISGEGPFRFLIDTGAQATVVARSLAERLALPAAGEGILVATGSRRAVNLVEITALIFADRELSLPAIPVLEREHLGADGILGLDALQDLRVLIDFRQNVISIADPEEERLTGRYEIIVRARKRLGQMIITDAAIDGVRTAVIVDTGAALSIGNRALERRLRARSQEEVESTDVNGVSFLTDLRIAKRVEIGSLSIDTVQIGFAHSPAFAALDLAERPALILGMSALQGLDRLAIDFAARKVMFDLPRDAGRRNSGRKASRWF